VVATKEKVKSEQVLVASEATKKDERAQRLAFRVCA
jgi:hypothetical protein